MENWSSVTDKIQYSIGQVIVEEGTNDYARPYRPPSSQSVRGSSFVVANIDDELYLLTNAHVTENELNIKLRFTQTGKKDIPAELLSFCYFKDIALIKVNRENSKPLLDRAVPLKLADSAEVRQADEVIVAGYPLGEENIQFATGVVSGFHTCLDQDSSGTDDGTAYIQITAPLNPGNSGGPALNRDGKVIGIGAAGYLFFQNIGYAIPTRTILAILPDMIRIIGQDTVMIYQPTLGFDWNNGSDELSQLKIGVSIDIEEKNKGGIYIRKVHPNSSFSPYLDYEDNFCHRLSGLMRKLEDEDKEDILVQSVQNALIRVMEEHNCSPINKSIDAEALLEKDLLLEIKIPSVYTDDAFNIPALFEDPGRLLNNCSGTVTFKIDHYGRSHIKGDNKITRQLDLQEIMDMIPINANVELTVIRRNKEENKAYRVELVRPYKAQEVAQWMVRKIYPQFEPERFDYVIFAGLSIAELARQFTVADKHYLDGPAKFGKHLVITAVFSGGSLDNLRKVSSGCILTHVNSEKVKTLVHLRKVLKRAKTYPILKLEFSNDAIVVLNTAKTIQSDTKVVQTYGIPETAFLREWLTS